MSDLIKDYLVRIDEVIEKGEYKDNWESLSRYPVANWVSMPFRHISANGTADLCTTREIPYIGITEENTVKISITVNLSPCSRRKNLTLTTG